MQVIFVPEWEGIMHAGGVGGGCSGLAHVSTSDQPSGRHANNLMARSPSPSLGLSLRASAILIPPCRAVALNTLVSRFFQAVHIACHRCALVRPHTVARYLHTTHVSAPDPIGTAPPCSRCIPWIRARSTH